jgi:ribosome-binding factor A
LAKQLRRERVAEQLRHELSDIIQHDMNDPRIGWVTLTRVEMSPDLCYAKVFVSVLGEEQVRSASLAVLKRAAAFLRSELGRRVRLRQVPELQFKEDHSLEHSQRIMDLLRTTDIPREDAGEGGS